MYLQFNKFFAPPDTGSGEVESETETFELLNVEEPEEVLDLPKPGKSHETTDADDTDKEEKDEEETDESEAEEELKEIEEELKPPKEEDLELELGQIVPRREILKKYPNLFKDFPHLEKAYYRERQFSEILPTIQDAKDAAEKAKILDNVEQQVMNGDLTSVLAATRQESPEAFAKLADNYLPALRRVDQQAYFHVLGNVIKDTIITMVKEGRALGEQQGAPLTAAANILNQFVFGSQNFTPPTTLSRQSNPQEVQRIQYEQSQQRQQVLSTFENVKDDLQTKADTVLKATINRDIDPNGSMTDYVKDHAIIEAHRTLESLMTKDVRFRGILDKLWERAFQRGFDQESQNKIKAAYLTKAKTLLPSVIKKARNDALKGLGRRSATQEEPEMESSVKKTPNSSGRSTSLPSGKIRKPSDIPRGMSTLDVLMKD